jgi:tetratricopeptide (TPR) repeat protein
LRTLNLLGALQTAFDGYEPALPYFERSLALAREQGIKEGIADALNGLGRYHLDLGDFPQAIAYYQEDLEVANEIGNPARIANSKSGLALVTLWQGELKTCEGSFVEIMQVRRRLGDHLGLMEDFASVTTAYNLLGDYQTSAQVCEEALALHEKVNNFPLVPAIYYFLAYGQISHGDFMTAGENLSHGLHLAQSLKNKVWRSLGHSWTAYYYLLVGRLEEGLAEARRAVNVAKTLGSPVRLLRSNMMVGVALRHSGDMVESQKILEEVRDGTREIGLVPDEVQVLTELIHIYIDDRQWEAVPAALERLLTLADTSLMREYMALARWLAARFALHKGETISARVFLLEARDLARKTGGRLSEILIEAELARAHLLEGTMTNAQQSISNAELLVARLIDGIDNEMLRMSFQQSRLVQRVRRIKEMVVM